MILKIMKSNEYVKINKDILIWLQKNLVGKTKKVEDWSYGDFYPEIVDIPILPADVEKEINIAIKRKTYNKLTE